MSPVQSWFVYGCSVKQHTILHVSTALLEAVSCLVGVMHSSRFANTLRNPLGTHTFTHKHAAQIPKGKSAYGSACTTCMKRRVFFFLFLTLDYLNSTSPLKSFKLGKISFFPWYLACLMTNKPSCWCLKSKEQLTQAKQTSLINPKCNHKSQKCKRLKNTKGTCLFFA